LKGHASVPFKTDQLADALRPVALLRAQNELDDVVVGHSSPLKEVRRIIIAGLGRYRSLSSRATCATASCGACRPTRLPRRSIFTSCNPHAHLNRAGEGLLAALRAAIDARPLSARTDE
jgi:hypothetical protein